MNLLIYIHSLEAGGAERVTLTLAKHWAACGHDVTVVTNEAVNTDFYPIDASIRRVSIGLDTGAALRRVRGVSNLFRIRRLRELLGVVRPDVAVGMMTGANCLLAIAGRGSPTVLIGSERVHPPQHRLPGAWEAARRITYRWLDTVVVQSQRTADWFRSEIPSARVVVIPNPVHLPLGRSAPEVMPEAVLARRPEETRVLLAVGRLDPQKGFDGLISAFGEACKQVSGWVLVIVGSGDGKASLEALIEDRGLQERVRLAGSVGNVGDWYAAADAFVLSSLYEGFPNCLLEAMAHDLPVAAADCETGPAELVDDGVSGLLYPAGDVSALEEVLLRIMSDEGLRAALASRAGGVREAYAVDRIGERWELLFHRGRHVER